MQTPLEVEFQGIHARPGFDREARGPAGAAVWPRNGLPCGAQSAWRPPTGGLYEVNIHRERPRGQCRGIRLSDRGRCGL
jgi:hypothetical protein